MINFKKSLVAAAVALSASSLSAVESYDVIDLGSLNDNPLWVYDINNSDTAVGYSYDEPTTTLELEKRRAYSYLNGTVTDLGTIVNEPIGDAQVVVDESLMFGVNNNGLAVGYSLQVNDSSVSRARAVYTDIGSDTINIIPELVTDEFENMRALSVNDNGLVVGFATTNPDDDTNAANESIDVFVTRGFVYDIGAGTITRVDPVNYAGTESNASVRDINNSGRLVGWSHELIENTLFARSFYADATDLAGAVEIPLTDDRRVSFPWAINDNNMIVGKRNVGEDTLESSLFFHGYIYNIADQTITDIPELNPGFIPDRRQGFSDISVAFDINNNNQVVGKGLVEVVPHTYHATIFENGTLSNLNNLIDCKVDPNAEAVGSPDWVLTEARAINDNGVIVGNGLLNGVRKAFMLVPRPGVPPRVCQNPEEDNGGSGGIPLWAMGLLSLVLFRPKRSKL